MPPSLLQQSGDSFASFLPGIAVSLCHVITGDVKQGHAVTKVCFVRSVHHTCILDFCPSVTLSGIAPAMEMGHEMNVIVTYGSFEQFSLPVSNIVKECLKKDTVLFRKFKWKPHSF